MRTTNRIYNKDCLIGMQDIEDNTIDCILTDPPYLYLKGQKLDRPFDETVFFNEVKRVLKKDGFIVLFGRGTSFYRWNTMLADLGFLFKEEIIWNKSYCSSPLMSISRVHETVSVFTKRNGTINRVKVPYLEMKRHDIDGIVTDINRLKAVFKNTKSLDAVLDFLERNKISHDGNLNKGLTVRPEHMRANRCISVMKSVRDGMNEKSIIRTDLYNSDTFTKYKATAARKEKSGDRFVGVMQSISFGMNEKSIIKQGRDHYATIHPTQKPVRLLERLLALVSKEGDLVLDPFSGSGSTAIAAYNTGRHFIGFEIDKEYYEASVERLNKVISIPKQTELFIA